MNAEDLYDHKIRDLQSSDYIRVLTSLIFFEAVTYSIFRGYTPGDVFDDRLWNIVRDKTHFLFETIRNFKKESLVSLTIRISRNIGLTDDYIVLRCLENAKTNSLIVSALECLETANDADVAAKAIKETRFNSDVNDFCANFVMWKLQSIPLAPNLRLIPDLISAWNPQRFIYVAFETIQAYPLFGCSLLNAVQRHPWAYRIAEKEAEIRGTVDHEKWRQCLYSDAQLDDNGSSTPESD